MKKIPYANVTVFISYARKDANIRSTLFERLADDTLKQVTEFWDDRRIHAAKDFEDQILAALTRADVILLLVSDHFLDSTFCMERELAIARRRAEDAVVRIIRLRECDLDTPAFEGLEVWPEDGPAVENFTKAQLTQETKRFRRWLKIEVAHALIDADLREGEQDLLRHLHQGYGEKVLDRDALLRWLPCAALVSVLTGGLASVYLLGGRVDGFLDGVSICAVVGAVTTLVLASVRGLLINKAVRVEMETSLRSLRGGPSLTSSKREIFGFGNIDQFELFSIAAIALMIAIAVGVVIGVPLGLILYFTGWALPAGGLGGAIAGLLLAVPVTWRFVIVFSPTYIPLLYEMRSSIDRPRGSWKGKRHPRPPPDDWIDDLNAYYDLEIARGEVDSGGTELDEENEVRIDEARGGGEMDTPDSDADTEAEFGPLARSLDDRAESEADLPLRLLIVHAADGSEACDRLVSTLNDEGILDLVRVERQTTERLSVVPPEALAATLAPFHGCVVLLTERFCTDVEGSDLAEAIRHSFSTRKRALLPVRVDAIEERDRHFADLQYLPTPGPAIANWPVPRNAWRNTAFHIRNEFIWDFYYRLNYLRAKRLSETHSSDWDALARFVKLPHERHTRELPGVWHKFVWNIDLSNLVRWSLAVGMIGMLVSLFVVALLRAPNVIAMLIVLHVTLAGIGSFAAVLHERWYWCGDWDKPPGKRHYSILDLLMGQRSSKIPRPRVVLRVALFVASVACSLAVCIVLQRTYGVFSPLANGQWFLLGTILFGMGGLWAYLVTRHRVPKGLIGRSLPVAATIGIGTKGGKLSIAVPYDHATRLREGQIAGSGPSEEDIHDGYALDTSVSAFIVLRAGVETALVIIVSVLFCALLAWLGLPGFVAYLVALGLAGVLRDWINYGRSWFPSLQLIESLWGVRHFGLHYVVLPALRGIFRIGLATLPGLLLIRIAHPVIALAVWLGGAFLYVFISRLLFLALRGGHASSE